MCVIEDEREREGRRRKEISVTIEYRSVCLYVFDLEWISLLPNDFETCPLPLALKT